MKPSLWLLTSLLSITSHAQSGANGGGSYVVLPDDTVVLADPYIPVKGLEGSFQCGTGEEGKISSELERELRGIGRLLVHYGACDQFRGGRSNPFGMDLYGDYENAQRSTFIDDHVLSGVHYCFVDQLPKKDETQLALIQNPNGQAVHKGSIGYTEGKVTWILKDVFKKMSLREQAKTLIHERLHAVAGNVPLGPIIDVTNGIETVLDLYHKQSKGDRSVLTDNQFTALQTLTDRFNDLGLSCRYEKYLQLTRNGGGRVAKSSVIDPSAFIGVGSLVGPDMRVDQNSVVLNSDICLENGYYQTKGQRWIGAASEIKNSTLYFCTERVQLESRAKLIDSILVFNLYTSLAGRPYTEDMTMVILKEDSLVAQSRFIHFGTLQLEKRARVENLDLRSGLQIRGLWNHETKVHYEFGEGSSVKNLSAYIYGYFGKWLNFYNRKPATLRFKVNTEYDYAGQKFEGIDIYGITEILPSS